MPRAAGDRAELGAESCVSCRSKLVFSTTRAAAAARAPEAAAKAPATAATAPSAREVNAVAGVLGEGGLAVDRVAEPAEGAGEVDGARDTARGEAGEHEASDGAARDVT